MRITGGIHRSRALRAPRGEETRPTSDRVREALFSILEHKGVLDRARVLDLYAGTGALALEAISRGATTAVLVESSARALAAIRANVASLGASAQTRLIAGDVSRAVHRIAAEGPFDLVMADPPWALVQDGTPQKVLSRLGDAGAFRNGALAILEHAVRDRAADIERVEGAEPIETRIYGDTALTFFKIGILRGAGSLTATLPSTDQSPTR